MFALFAGPVVYSLLGAAVLSFGSQRRRMLLSPLVGVIAAGWAAELGFLLGNARHGIIAGCVLGGLTLASRPRAIADWWATLPTVLVASVPATAAILVSPYPGVGLWCYDYIEYFAMGRAIRDGAFQAWMIQRPPLFGAAALLMEPAARDLPALQTVSAVSSSGALLALKWLTGCSMRTLWTVAALPLFFLHTVTGWPKMLSAGSVIAAIGYFERRDAGSRWSGAAFFAAAAAAHTAALLMAPIFVAQALRRRTIPGWAGDLCRVAVAFVLIPAPFEAWTIAKFGVTMKQKANPVYYYDRPAGPVGTIFGNLVGTFSGWPERSRWSPAAQHQFPWFGANFMKAATFLSWEAGTFFGLLFPMTPLLWHRRRSLARWFGRRWREVIAGTVVVVLNAVANPMVNLSGVTQTGLTSLCLLLLVPVAREFDRRGAGRSASIWMALVFGLGLSFGTHVAAFAAMDEWGGRWWVSDAYQQARIGQMYAVGLKTILLDFGWPAAALGCVLACLQTAVVRRGLIDPQ